MAAEGTEIPTAPAVQENTNDAGAETKTGDVETSDQTNGHSELTAADQTKLTEDSKEETQNPEQSSESTVPDSPEEKIEEPKAGDKREHDTSATTSAETNQPAAGEESSKPTAKKQKTDTTKAKNGTSAPKEETNGEENKTKGGRGKKAKPTAAKPAVSTDGPGSRTRSRTKAAA